jgi:CBS domain containing-hemolysin-like protein
VAAEFGLVAVDPGRIEARAEQGSRRARLARGLLKRLSFALGGAQLGISLVSLMLGFIAEPVIAQAIHPVFDPWLGRASEGVSIAIALALATGAQMVFGELIPKSIAIAEPERATLTLAPFMRSALALLSPVIRLTNGSANALLRLFGVEPLDELSHVRTLPELAVLFQASAAQGTIAGSASVLVRRSIRFGEKSAADALVPRVDVVAVGEEATAADLVRISAETGHSRLPVYGRDLDDIVGVVHVRSVHAVPTEKRTTTPVRELMGEALLIPESRELVDVLVDIRRTRNHLAVVLDEYGGTAGILTLEDVLEEIVGEIDDEYDQLTPRLTQRDGRWEFAGTMHLDEVAETAGLVLPEGEYETLAGFVLDRLGRVPMVGDHTDFEGWQLEVAAMDRRRIDRVHVRAPGTATRSAEDATP